MLAEHGGRTVRIRALPIGIPFAHFETMAKMAPAKALSHGNIKIILGVDRLDYTKGSKSTCHDQRCIKIVYVNKLKIMFLICRRFIQ